MSFQIYLFINYNLYYVQSLPNQRPTLQLATTGFERNNQPSTKKVSTSKKTKTSKEKKNLERIFTAMGCCQSTRSGSIVFDGNFIKANPGHFVLEFLSAQSVPRADLTSESDPYLRAYISNSNKSTLRLSNYVQTIVRIDNPEPVWNSFHDFGFTPPSGAILHCEIYDQDVGRDELLGQVDIPIENFQDDGIKAFKFSFLEYGSNATHPNFSVTIRRHFIATPPPKVKTFFIIRHGESKWNEGQAHHNIVEMLDHDHSLTRKGIDQAASLNLRLKEYLRQSEIDSVDGTGNSDYTFISKLKKATRVYASPLTRAVQTALVATEGHPALQAKGLTLYR